MKEERSPKVGARSLCTRADKKMRVKGIPITEYKMQVIFPVGVMGWMCPYPSTK